MKMTTKKMMGLLAIAAPLMTMQASAEFTGSLTADYATMYEFRGVNRANNLVDTTLSLSTEYNGFTVSGGIWNAFTDDDSSFVDNEARYRVSVSRAFGPVTAELGYVYYTFPGDTDFNTQELFISGSMEVYNGVIATVTGSYDFDLFEGWYIDANLSKSFKVNDILSVVLSGGMGAYQSYGYFDNGVNHLYLKASVPYVIKQDVTVTPYVKYTNADSDFPADFTTQGDDFGGENLIGGISVGIAF
jgi:hypothetical protein